MYTTTTPSLHCMPRPPPPHPTPHHIVRTARPGPAAVGLAKACLIDREAPYIVVSQLVEEVRLRVGAGGGGRGWRGGQGRAKGRRGADQGGGEVQAVLPPSLVPQPARTCTPAGQTKTLVPPSHCPAPGQHRCSLHRTAPGCRTSSAACSPGLQWQGGQWQGGSGRGGGCSPCLQWQ